MMGWMRMNRSCMILFKDLSVAQPTQFNLAALVLVERRSDCIIKRGTAKLDLICNSKIIKDPFNIPGRDAFVNIRGELL